LSTIPILRYLFGSKDHTIADDDIVFVVVPHIVRSQDLDRANLRPIDTGSGQSIDLRHADGAQSNSASSMVIHPSAVSVTPVGSVQGASAEGAAPALMAQLRAAAQNTGNTPATPPANPPPPAAPPLNAGPPPAPPAPAPPPSAAPTAGRASFAINSPTTPVASGSSFQVPIVLNAGTDIASVPIQLQYDPAKLSLINVSAGDLLNRDGQAGALIHRDDGPGNVTVVAARPPGAAGITGSGTVCVLTFQAKAAGTTSLNLSRAGAVDSKQQPVQADSSQTSIVIQ
jgi:general secretion pathway protein D